MTDSTLAELRVTDMLEDIPGMAFIYRPDDLRQALKGLYGRGVTIGHRDFLYVPLAAAA